MHDRGEHTLKCIVGASKYHATKKEMKEQRASFFQQKYGFKLKLTGNVFTCGFPELTWKCFKPNFGFKTIFARQMQLLLFFKFSFFIKNHMSSWATGNDYMSVNTQK